MMHMFDDVFPNQSSFELPIGSEIQFLEEDAIPVANVAEVHEAAVDVSNVSHFLVPKELIV